MMPCKSIGCPHTTQGQEDFCAECATLIKPGREGMLAPLPLTADDTPEYTGNHVSYYRVPVADPKSSDLQPYTAECEDIIEALGMSFAEGCAFKALWRKCAARTLGLKKAGYRDGLYDAEKAVYYTKRALVAEKKTP